MVTQRHVFISYKREDQEKARELKLTLEASGIEVWWDEEIYPGDQWEEMIDKAIEASSALIVILTSNALKSHWITYEWAYALFHNKDVCPIDFEGLDYNKIHEKLRRQHIISYGDMQKARLIEKLLNGESISTGIIRLPKNAPPFLHNAVNDLESLDPKVQQTAINGLIESPHPLALEILIAAIQHYVPKVPIKAALGIAQKTRFKDDRAIPELIKELGTGSRSYYSQCVEALRSYRNIASPYLINGLKTENNDVRRIMIGLLGENKDISAINSLIDALQDNSPHIRMEAVAALGKIGVPEVAPHLVTALRDENEGVRKNAEEALWHQLPDLSLATDELLNLLFTHPNVHMRELAAVWLRKSQDTRIVQGLIAAVGVNIIDRSQATDKADIDKYIASNGRKAIIKTLGLKGSLAFNLLQDALHHEDWLVRAGVAEALGYMGDKASTIIEQLGELLNDPEPYVRWAATFALGKLDDISCIPYLSTSTKDENWLVRRGAAFALGTMQDRPSAPLRVDILKELLHDTEENVRIFVAQALDMINHEESN